tara:strand:+ start:216 stop:563 length:348 start_codon:yes stop_codon:yes gene_type:complete
MKNAKRIVEKFYSWKFDIWENNRSTWTDQDDDDVSEIVKLLDEQARKNATQEMIDEDEVNSLVSEIIHTLQDDYGYLKPQPKSTKGNIQGNGIYNWEAHNVLEDLIKKRYHIKED